MAQASPTFADSDPGDEFSNNLFSDLAPLLVLFGEQVAMQFIAESLGWADIIIFSMAPVGVLTAVVGAIRVGGANWLKALIGRTKENIAVAESQLMSSTSNEVCEVFNGRHVVRLMGKPSIKELIFMEYNGFTAGRGAARQRDRFLATSKALEEEYLTTADFPGYPTFEQLRERVKSGNDLSHNEIRQHNHSDPKRGSIRRLVMTLVGNYLSSPRYSGVQDRIRNGIGTLLHLNTYTDSKRLDEDRERLRAISQHSPNISLNAHPRDGRSELHVVAALGIFLQLGVLVFDWFITYHPTFKQKKGGRDIGPYAFPLTCVGTLVLITGLLVCCYIIENATRDEIHRPKAGDLQMLWVQQGGSVNDQVFDSYLVLAREKSGHVITSRRQGMDRGDRTSLITTTLTAVGAVVTMAGFVLQFVGLRSMSWHASIAQLVATIIMIILRAYVRRGLSQSPWASPIPKDHEIDWLATRISNDTDRDRLLGRGGERPRDEARSWRSVFLGTNKENELPIYPWNDSNSDHFWDKGPFRFEIRAVGDFSRYKKLTAIPEYSMGESIATGHIDARINLGVETGWSGPALDQAICVASAIESIMNAFFPKSSNSKELVWGISDALVGDIRFNLSLVNSVWKVDLEQIEAFLSLWLFSVSEKELQVTGSKTRNGTDKGLSGTIPGNHSLRLLAPKSTSQLQCMHWWLGGAIALVETLIPSFETAGTDAFQIDLKTPKGWSCYAVDGTSVEFERHRIVGFQGVPPHGENVLAVMTNVTLDLLYAQELFSAFIRSFVQFKPMMSPIKGSIKSMIPLQEIGESSMALFESIALENKELDRVVKFISLCGLGSVEDIMLCIIPPLIEGRILDHTPVAYAIRDYARLQESSQRWESAGDLYITSLIASHAKFMNGKEANNQATCALTEFIRELTLEINITEQFREQKYHRLNEKQFNRTQELIGLRDNIRKALLDRGDIDVLRAIRKVYGWQKRDEGVEVWWPKQELSSPEFDGPEGIDLDQRFAGLSTTLHRVVAKDMVTQFKLSLRRKTRRNAETGPLDPRDFAGFTPLHYVKSVYIAQNLLTAGTSITAKGHDGMTPLHNAAQAGNREIVELFIGYGCDLNLLDNHRRTPLHWAAYEGHSGVVRLLLKNGADPLAVSEHLRSPLHMAAGGGHLEVVRALIKSGREDINAPDSDGRTALHLAVAGNHTTVISHLSPLSSFRGSWAEDRSGFTAIHLGAFLGYTEAVKAALGAGQYTESEGGVRQSFPASATLRTVLHAAAQSGKTEVIEYILTLEYAPSIDAKDSAGETPLMCAASHGQNDVVKLLLRSGSKVDAVNRSGRSALHLVVMEKGSSHLDVIKTLLAAGPNSNLQDEDGFTPLLRAVYIGNISAVKILIPGSNIDAVDHDKRTALHLAVTDVSTYISRPLIELLVSSGANINVKDNNGKTPTQYPVVRRLVWLRDYFAEKGGKVIDTDVGRIRSTGALKRGRYESELTDDECSDEERFYRKRVQY